MHTQRKQYLVPVCLLGLFLGLGASTPVTAVSQQRELVVIGAVEPVKLLPQGFVYPARIDTGATTSSIHALDITRIERDGEKMVRFSLIDPQSRAKVEITAPLVRVVSIKRHGTGVQKRMVVRLRVVLGPVEDTVEFSLTDRANYTFPLLVGRNLLEGRFLVDTSRAYTTGSR